MARDRQTPRSELRTEAAHWVVRFSSGSATPEERAAFEAWLRTSLDHRIAYERESSVWERAERLRVLHAGPVPAEHSRLRLRERFAALRRQLVVLAAAALLASAAGLYVYRQTSTEQYATTVGERRILRLEDGSRLELNTDSRVAVRMSSRRREIELLRGESLFDVQPDASRPFVVHMGDNSVRAVGTAFTVRRDEEGAYRVVVTKGIVEVSSPAAAATPAYRVRVAAGSSAVRSRLGLATRTLSANDLERALSWREGVIALAGESLSEAAAEFNRYNERQLVITDPAVAELRLGGYFDAHDVGGFVRVLTTSFGLRAEEAGMQIRLSGSGTSSAPIGEAPPPATAAP